MISLTPPPVRYLQPLWLSVLLLWITLFVSPSLYAHAAERGFVLLLPTRFYLLGGTMAVAATFALSLLINRDRLPMLLRRVGHWPLPPARWRQRVSLASTLLLWLLIIAGATGSTDPLSNPLPLTVWTVLWVGMTLAQALFGNLWAALNPWSGVCGILRRWLLRARAEPPLSLPQRFGCLLALPGFAAFAWYELVSLSPEDPRQLAVVVSIYWLCHAVGATLFGERDWLGRVEPLSVFFRFVAMLSPFRYDTTAATHVRCSIGWPGCRVLSQPTLHWSGSLLILMSLATVSFDGLNKTFWWLHLMHINPLEFAGRSSVTTGNSLGLIAAVVLLSGAFAAAVRWGWYLAGSETRWTAALVQQALSLLPISLAYHFAHYLTQLLVNGQYLLKAWSDPFAQGIDLLGFADLTVTTSFLSHQHSVERLWQFQVGAIVVGHMLAVLLSHLLALQHHPTHRRAIAGHAPLAGLMVLYTLFGLWLLATPTGL